MEPLFSENEPFILPPQPEIPAEMPPLEVAPKPPPAPGYRARLYRYRHLLFGLFPTVAARFLRLLR